MAGRHTNYPRGEKHWKAKLTEGRVRNMRSLHYKHGWSIRRLAKEFNVAYSTAWQVINWETWIHLT